RLHRHHGVVARQGQVDRVGAVAVEHRRHLVRAAKTAGSALTELGSQLGSDLDIGHGGTPRKAVGGQATRRARAKGAHRLRTASITEPSQNSALAEATTEV